MDKPILFKAPMVCALLDGTKTQTRRDLSLRGYKDFTEFQPSKTKGYDWTFRRFDLSWVDLTHEQLLALLKWQVGDRLWVKETWRADLRYDSRKPRDIPKGSLIEYTADQSFHDGKTRVSIFMPRWASRLTLTVTDVLVQRLQSISRGDAMDEGCPFPNMANPCDWYHDLWDRINGAGAWEQNPWVVALMFTVEQRNIDAGKASVA